MLAGLTTAFGFGKPLSPLAVSGMCLAFTGCLVLPFSRFSEFRLSQYFDKSFVFVFFVALGTTGYTLCDSQAQKVLVDAAYAAGVEASKTILSVTYYSYRSLLLASAMWVAVLCGRRSRTEAAALWKNRSWTPVLAGCCSSMTYVLVLVAMHFVTNVAYVQAFRQVGLLFGLAEAVFVLKERCTALKLVGTALILAGLALSTL
jgi:drug/metabolite transporter (DMT)-like permease